jgi:hypothetical protein
MKQLHLFLLLALMVIASGAMAQNNTIAQNQNGFTQSDRERLIRMEAILEQHEKRFEELHSTNTWIISLFSFLTVTIITLAFWDRRSSLRPIEGRTKVIEMEIEELKKETSIGKVIAAFREMAKDNPKIAEVLKNNNLL